MPTEPGGDIDKAWKMLQRMAIAPNVGVGDQGDDEIDGLEARHKSCFQSAGADKLLGSTWLILGDRRLYMVTGMCLEGNKDAEGKAILKSIKGIKLIEPAGGK